jgi:ribosomal protein S18 acetylase RimI-like enzyme
MEKNDLQKIEMRNLELSDYLELKHSMEEAYKNSGNTPWREKQIKKLLDIFPEGQIAVLVDGKIVGTALTLIINYDKFSDDHTYEQITGNNTFKTHDPDGDVLYGIEVFIHPDYRGLRLGRRLYDARKELCEQLNLKSIIAGGRIPFYSQYSDTMTPKEYINKVKSKEIYDPVLSFQHSMIFMSKKF